MGYRTAMGLKGGVFGGVLSIKKLLCLIGGLRYVCRWAGVGNEVQEGAAGQLCFFD